MRTPGIRSVSWLAALAIGLGFVACTDEETVFVEQPRFEDPPQAAVGFLGYDEADEKLTTCGNCHVGQQGEWENTAHADAWAGLQGSGHAQEFCEGCHTVSELGNAVADQAVGWTATGDERYHDVQCESCHAAGLDHVTNPDASQPLAPIAVGAELTTGCGECHQGTHHPFVSEWTQSKHARPWGEFFPGGIDAGAAAAVRPECQACHEGKGALRAWGVNDEYLEKGSSEFIPHTCSICHDPHDAENTAQLRFPINVADVEQHLCARCHDRRTSPDPTSSHGLHPHSPETALLSGEAGWFPPGANIDAGQIVATHGSEANEGLCATCHLPEFEVTDAETGDFVLHATGHLFEPMPCVDAQGIPEFGDCDLTTDARNFTGCTASGCHGSEAAAASALVAASGRIMNLAEELHELLLEVDPNGEDAGGEIDAGNPNFTVAEGAFFNYALAHMSAARFGGDRPDPRLDYTGTVAHNPFLIESLLIASIEAVEDEYGVTASPRISLARELR